jgi:uncharacterized protein with PhoU and TrkA domain
MRYVTGIRTVKPRILISILFLLLLMVTASCTCSDTGTSTIEPPSELTLLSIAEGQILVIKFGNTNWIEAEAGTTVALGDTLKAGDDSVVSPGYIGGLRMASEMIRPTVVSFLDIMLRDRDSNLRVEEVTVRNTLAGKTVSELDLGKYRHLLLLAVRTGEDWIYNPPADYALTPGCILVVMTTPEDRTALEEAFQSA